MARPVILLKIDPWHVSGWSSPGMPQRQVCIGGMPLTNTGRVHETEQF
jgi:hypothetical protein